MIRQSIDRLARAYRRRAAGFVFKRPLRIVSESPLVSFTFDDFPRSALTVGGAILTEFGARGTYYASLGLAGQQAPTGRIFDLKDLPALCDAGHELGCHTYGHHHSWQTPAPLFEASVVENANTIERLLPGTRFRSFSYPICAPRPLSKSRVAKHFECCRSGGQAHNAGTADLNQLKAFFLEKSKGRLEEVRRIVEVNARDHGWLIFATHDVDANPTPFGCTPTFLAAVVEHALSSGARVLPVGQALDLLVGRHHYHGR